MLHLQITADCCSKLRSYIHIVWREESRVIAWARFLNERLCTAMVYTSYIEEGACFTFLQLTQSFFRRIHTLFFILLGVEIEYFNVRLNYKQVIRKNCPLCFSSYHSQISKNSTCHQWLNRNSTVHTLSPISWARRKWAVAWTYALSKSPIALYVLPRFPCAFASPGWSPSILKMKL